MWSLAINLIILVNRASRSCFNKECWKSPSTCNWLRATTRRDDSCQRHLGQWTFDEITHDVIMSPDSSKFQSIRSDNRKTHHDPQDNWYRRKDTTIKSVTCDKNAPNLKSSASVRATVKWIDRGRDDWNHDRTGCYVSHHQQCATATTVANNSDVQIIFVQRIHSKDTEDEKHWMKWCRLPSVISTSSLRRTVMSCRERRPAQERRRGSVRHVFSRIVGPVAMLCGRDRITSSAREWTVRIRRRHRFHDFPWECSGTRTSDEIHEAISTLRRHLRMSKVSRWEKQASRCRSMLVNRQCQHSDDTRRDHRHEFSSLNTENQVLHACNCIFETREASDDRVHVEHESVLTKISESRTLISTIEKLFMKKGPANPHNHVGWRKNWMWQHDAGSSLR